MVFSFVRSFLMMTIKAVQSIYDAVRIEYEEKYSWKKLIIFSYIILFTTYYLGNNNKKTTTTYVMDGWRRSIDRYLLSLLFLHCNDCLFRWFEGKRDFHTDCCCCYITTLHYCACVQICQHVYFNILISLSS